MKVQHHPSDETLASFASGTLDEGRSLVVATHLSLCAHCRLTVRTFEEVGGAFLDQAEPAAMRADALDRALNALDATEKHAALTKSRSGEDIKLPAPLENYKLGPWRWLGSGIQLRTVDVPSKDNMRVFMLRAAPGKQIPHHRHTGIEWTCILQGAFRHDGGHFGPGDFDEADETIEHKPVVEEGVPCICLVALQGNIEFQGWFGRLLQPFVRI